MNDLDTLINTPRSVTLAGGDSLDIGPLEIRELPAFTRAVEPFIQHAYLHEGGNATDLVIHMLTHDVDRLIDMVVVGARIDREKFGRMHGDDLILLATAVVEVNLDFFIRRMLPQINAAMQSLLVRLAGSTLSPDLSTTDSPPTT